jgi:hypothetical protein
LHEGAFTADEEERGDIAVAQVSAVYERPDRRLGVRSWRTWSLAGMLFVAVVRARRNPIGRGLLPGLVGQAGSYLLTAGGPTWSFLQNGLRPHPAERTAPGNADTGGAGRSGLVSDPGAARWECSRRPSAGREAAAALLPGIQY